MSEEFTFFWKGPLSQWAESYFEVDGVTYNCTEQWMMAQKARLFEDEDTLELILESESPKRQKELGRLVEGFDVDVWEEDESNGRPRCWNIVWEGNVAKFSQNRWMLDELLATGSTTLVEASPFDRIWGIGLRDDDPRAQRREGWLGRNWLGEVLTDVRAHLRRQQ